jgi:type II secretory pathway component PulF
MSKVNPKFSIWKKAFGLNLMYIVQFIYGLAVVFENWKGWILILGTIIAFSLTFLYRKHEFKNEAKLIEEALQGE